MEAPEVRYAQSGDVSIAYSVVGDGPFDLVFVSGWVLSVLESAWDGPAADTLSRLASFSRLILFDKRGTGLSDRATASPTWRRGWTTSVRSWMPQAPREPPSWVPPRAVQ
jgi:pimeloyl-ACP methyl ester carboxylesterase